MASEGHDIQLIAVMGATGSGKTSFINLASGSSLPVGEDLASCTDKVQFSEPFTVDNREIIFMDTPGFDDTEKSDTEILRMISETLAIVYENKKTLAGLIYVHRISDFRMGGTSTKNFRMFRKLCGDKSLKNVVIVTNMWGEVDRTKGEAREAQLKSEDKFFKPALDNGAIMMRHDGPKSINSAYRVLRAILKNHPIPLKIQTELVDEKKSFSETAAAEELNRELTQQLEKCKKEIEQLKQEMAEALKEKDMELKRELEKAEEQMQKKMDKVQRDQDKLKSRYEQANRSLSRQFEALRREKEMELYAADRQDRDTRFELEKAVKGMRILHDQLEVQSKEKNDLLRQAARDKQQAAANSSRIAALEGQLGNLLQNKEQDERIVTLEGRLNDVARAREHEANQSKKQIVELEGRLKKMNRGFFSNLGRAIDSVFS